MCFIDLQKKAYDTVDRLLWQVLTRIGVLPQMFLDAMGACVRPDDGVCLGWFEVEQGLRIRPSSPSWCT